MTAHIYISPVRRRHPGAQRLGLDCCCTPRHCRRALPRVRRWRLPHWCRDVGGPSPTPQCNAFTSMLPVAATHARCSCSGGRPAGCGGLAGRADCRDLAGSHPHQASRLLMACYNSHLLHSFCHWHRFPVNLLCPVSVLQATEPTSCNIVRHQSVTHGRERQRAAAGTARGLYRCKQLSDLNATALTAQPSTCCQQLQPLPALLGTVCLQRAMPLCAAA